MDGHGKFSCGVRYRHFEKLIVWGDFRFEIQKQIEIVFILTFKRSVLSVLIKMGFTND